MISPVSGPLTARCGSPLDWVLLQMQLSLRPCLRSAANRANSPPGQSSAHLGYDHHCSFRGWSGRVCPRGPDRP